MVIHGFVMVVVYPRRCFSCGFPPLVACASLVGRQMLIARQTPFHRLKLQLACKVRVAAFPKGGGNHPVFFFEALSGQSEGCIHTFVYIVRILCMIVCIYTYYTVIRCLYTCTYIYIYILAVCNNSLV